MNQFSDFEEDVAAKPKFRQRWPLVLQLYPRLIHPRARAIGFGAHATNEKQRLIQALYDKIVARLRLHYKKSFDVTPAEDEFLLVFKKHSKLKDYRSCWIGNRCIDVFFPQIGSHSGFQVNGRAYAGVAIEIDGSYHKHHLKQKKDLAKIDFLAEMGIQTIPLQNGHVNKSIAYKLIEELLDRPRLDHRGTQRVWSRVWLSTIAAHSTDEEFFELENSLTNNSTK